MHRTLVEQDLSISIPCRERFGRTLPTDVPPADTDSGQQDYEEERLGLHFDEG
jgi:hypothetical protein